MTEARDSGPGPEASTGFWLLRAASRWQRDLGRRLRPLGLTTTQFTVLSCAGWLGATSEGPPTQQEVADLAGIDRMMASKVITTLEALGLLARDTNGRTKTVQQTDSGRAVTLAALPHVRAVEDELFGDLPDTATVRLRRALAAVAAVAGT